MVPWGAQLAAFALVVMLLVHLLVVLLTDITSPFWPQSVSFLSQAIPGFLEPAMRSALVAAPFVLLLAFLLWRGLKLGAVGFFLVALWEAAMFGYGAFPLAGSLAVEDVITLVGTAVALVFSLIALKSLFSQRGGGIFR